MSKLFFTKQKFERLRKKLWSIEIILEKMDESKTFSSASKYTELHFTISYRVYIYSWTKLTDSFYIFLSPEMLKKRNQRYIITHIFLHIRRLFMRKNKEFWKTWRVPEIYKCSSVEQMKQLIAKIEHIQKKFPTFKSMILLVPGSTFYFDGAINLPSSAIIGDSVELKGIINTENKKIVKMFKLSKSKLNKK